MAFVDITDFFLVDPPVGTQRASWHPAKEGAKTERGSEDSALADMDPPLESYLYDFCRSIENIDFTAPAGARGHDGTRTTSAPPTVRGKVAWRASAVRCADEWRLARTFAATAHLKYTLPGPMTIISRIRNEHYAEERELAEDLAAIINAQVRALVSAGCRGIHIEEPALAQELEGARAWGIEVVGRCVEGAGEGCELSINSGCGCFSSRDGHHLQSYLDEFARMAQAVDSSCPSSLLIQL